MTSVEIAASLIGQGEIGGNNRGPFIAKLFRNARPAGNWCAAFVATCLENAGVVPILRDRDRRGAKRLTRVVARRGRWVIAPGALLDDPLDLRAIPMPGDVIAWHLTIAADWRGHVELVEQYDDCSDTMLTLAGNVGRLPAQVTRRYYSAGTWRRKLFGVARPR